MTEHAQDWLTLDGCRVDLVRGTVVAVPSNQTRATLTTIERRLLAHLACHAERAVARDELLEQVWGYQGQIVTRTVDVAIRRLRSKLEVDPAVPTHIVTVHGAGYRFAGPIPVLRDASAATVPPELTELVGRSHAIQTIEQLLSSGARAVTVTGSGGIGKSRLAVHLAHKHTGGAVFVELADATDEHSVVAAVAAALGVHLTGSTVEAATERIRRPLAQRPDLLVVLNNAETVIAPLRALLVSCLAGTQVHFLVTSRRILRMAGEHRYLLRPLSAAAGRALFLQRRAQLLGEQGDDEGLDELVRALDGNPLALELAAARSSVLSPSALLARLDERLSLLTARDGQVQHRHSSLRDVLQTSWALLTDDERRVAAWCSVFRGGFDLRAVGEVLGDPQLDVVEALVDHSLLRPVETPTGLRLRMDESVRAYALEQLADDAPAVRQAHAAFYAAWGMDQRSRLRSADGNAVLHALHVERLNLLAALYATQDPNTALTLGLVLHALGTARGPLSMRDDAVRHALSVGADGAPLLRSELLVVRMEPMRTVRDAEELAHELDIAQALCAGNDAARARVDLARAELAHRLGDVPEALRLAQRATVHLTPSTQADGSVLVARCLQRLGDVEAARPAFDTALAYATRNADVLGEARTRFFAAFLDERFGRMQRAAERLERACECFGEVGNFTGEATARVTLAGVYLDHGHLEEASAQLDLAMALARRIGDLYSEGIATINLGNLHLVREERRAAADCFRHAVAVLYRQGAPADEAVALANLGIAERDSGLIQQVLLRCDELGLKMLGSIALAWLAAMQAVRGESEPALKNLDRARRQANHASAATVEVLAGVVELESGVQPDALSDRLPGPNARVDERIAGVFLEERLAIAGDHRRS